MKRMGLMLAIAALLAAADAPDGTRWWSYVSFLASDDLEGRNTGSPGHKKAAMYVAGQFERAGLLPGGTRGYIQPVPFNTMSVDESKSVLTLIRDGKETPVKFGDEAFLGARGVSAEAVETDLVFVGYGLTIPEINHDDFKGLNVKGKIAVVFAGAPPGLSAPLASHYQSGSERAATLKAAGAAGVVNIANPKHSDIPWARVAGNRGQMAMALADPKAGESGGRVGIIWNPAKADMLFAGTGHSLDEIVEAAESKKPLPHFEIPAKLRARAAINMGSVESQNVIAIYPGSDPQLKNEYVVISAHIDHLGVGKPVNGDAIFNGAMDNASGVAALLDTAAYLKETGVKSKRSILFVVVTGEEKGLLGSRFFSMNPTVRAGAIVADINTDMFLPLYPLKRLFVYGIDESTLGDDVRTIAKASGLEIEPDPDPQANRFIRSDQYSFILRGIPSVSMKDGYVPGSPEEKIFKTWMTERYHAVSDDLNQPVDKEAAADFDRFVAKLLVHVANADRKPEWKKDSFFRRYENAK